MAILLIIIKILLYLLLFIVGLILLLLLVPLSYRGRVLTEGGFRAEAGVGWAWRLLGISVEMDGVAADVAVTIFNRRVLRFNGGKSHEIKEAAVQESEEEKTSKKKKSELGIRDIANKALIEEIIDYIKRVLGILKPKYLHLYGTYGFDDPSVTGILAGMTGIIRGMVPHARIALNPDFTSEVLDIDFFVEGSMTAGSLVYQTVRTMLRKPVRKLWFRRKKS